jgi:hypothetical protein
MADAFFAADGNHYIPTELTRGPWEANSQHAGPPAALIGREIARLGRDGERELGRVTYEILRPVPIAPLTVDARVVRPGRAVELVEASLADADGEVIRARGWLLRRGDVDIPSGLSSDDGPGALGTSPSTLRPGFAPPGPDEAEPGRFFDTGQDVGYHTAMEYRFVRGGFVEPGPAVAWMRMRVRLVDDEEPTPLERVLVAADSGNGVSSTLDWSRFVFINVDLSVHLHRPMSGEWVCLDAITIPERSGIGIADTALYDERGPIGRADQTLLVDARR